MKACRTFPCAAALLVCLSATAQEWQTTPKSDPLTGKSYLTFMLPGKFLTPPVHSNGDAPRIVVKCEPGPHLRMSGKLLEAYIDTTTVIDTKDSQQQTTVEYRLDDGKVRFSASGNTSNYQGIPLDAPFLDDILWGHLVPHKPGTSRQVRKFVVAVKEHLSGQIVMQFDMPDATQVGAACGTEYK
jgi:hypothetical protein